MSRRRILFGVVGVALLVSTGLYLGAGVFDPPTEQTPDVSPPPENKLVVVDNDSAFWPYTSKTRSTGGRTLAVNVVIYGDTDQIRAALTDRSGLAFEELPEREADAGNDSYEVEPSETDIEWNEASGSARYTYVRTADGGQWLGESYQYHDGAYLGDRHHLRAYEDPEGNFTAIQIHREYFDFFQLRHNVVDLERSATMVEAEFIGEPFVEEVSRDYYDTRGRYFDGWASAIHLETLFPLGLFALLGSVVSGSTRRAVRSLVENLGSWARTNRAGFALAAGLVAVVLGTRAFAIGLETTISSVSPQILAGVAYPILAFGPPIVLGIFGRKIDALAGFGFAVFGLLAALTLDTIWVGLGVIPVQVFLHRFGLALALGVVALGVGRDIDDDPGAVEGEQSVLVLVGLLAWFVGLALSLFGFV